MEEIKEIDNFNLDKELKYIDNEIMARRLDGLYMKYSKPLRGISVEGITAKNYLNYYTSKYKTRPKEEQDIIKQHCLNKLKKGLISRQKMKELIEQSSDNSQTKQKLILLLCA